MSVEYYYMNDLNTLYNASVGDKTDGGEHHMKMMVAHDNLEAYMQKMEHWRDTALQLSRNNGEAQAKIDALEADYVISNRELLVKQVEIQRLTARIAELEAAQRWHVVKECNDVATPIDVALRKRIAELEGDNKKAFDLVRKLRMYCIWANWDNPDTEDEFNEFDVEVCKWLSKFMEREE